MSDKSDYKRELDELRDWKLGAMLGGIFGCNNASKDQIEQAYQRKVKKLKSKYNVK